MAVRKEPFGAMPDGREISLYTLENMNGLQASFSDVGAVWVGMLVPDRRGNLADVVLGYDGADAYLTNGPHFGAIVGRIANRTEDAKFWLNGKLHRLGANSGGHNLHSGPDYYDRRLWTAAAGPDGASVIFSLDSPDGDQGYPGDLRLKVTYRLTGDNLLDIIYEGECSKDTPLNLTNHSYFNLAGHNSGDVLAQKVWIDAKFFTPATQDSITTGEILKVAGTPMDFTEAKAIGRDIGADDIQLKRGSGYDHNWCLNHRLGDYACSAGAMDEASGRALEVWTDMPGIQFYTANFLDREAGKNGAVYGRRGAFCFETQYYPDSVNKMHFGSPVIKAGQKYTSRTSYRFYIEK